MSEHLEELEKLIGNYEYYADLIGSEKGYVEKVFRVCMQMITMTEIKKALAVQNSILKKEN